MIKGTTQTGFSYEIDDKRLANYELLEYLSELDTNPLLLPKIVKILLGDQAIALKNHVRDENGLVDMNKMSNEISDIFENQKQLKN
ncbi:hypothetical protein KG091_07740 [Carnobacteriaceae bacterium zg-ZUI78]|nr:hypothetical protein [Carnobacteriaceae bacterium zg-ZUI78]